jgi:transposase InsO family protein
MSDRELLSEIRDVLGESPFVGEGHRTVWARLRRRGMCTSRKRVLRLTREAGLLAPTARVRKRAQRLHDGTITVGVPDTLWATDASEGWTEEGGSCFRSEHYQVEIDHLGIARSPAYHYEPETNGCAEKFIQTLKEQVLWIERFDTFEQLRAAVRKFTVTYNHEWLLEHHSYRTPLEAQHTPPRSPRQQWHDQLVHQSVR